MPQRTDLFDLARLGLTSGEGRRLDLAVAVEPLQFGGQEYAVSPDPVEARVDVSRTTANGWALRLRFTAALDGPCMRCLEPAHREIAVDAREVHQAGADDLELVSPYVSADAELDLAAWARDALVLALPAQITCRPDCAGLCPRCGANLNEDPDHAHEREADPRWAKLSELKLD
jgi:uncharacterized protein